MDKPRPPSSRKDSGETHLRSEGATPFTTPPNFIKDIIDEDMATGNYQGRVHTRFSPEPNGYLHIGHAKSINVRTGPGTSFPVLLVAPPGSTAEITGRSSDNAWWQVRVPTRVSSNGLAWVSASFVVAQNTSNVPVVNAPPAPPTVAAVPPIASAGGCSIVSQSPANTATFNANTPFTTTWVLQNSGSQAWDRTSVDIRFVSALNNVVLHTGPSLFDLSTTVNPGGTYNFSQSMLAPWTAGNYGEFWELVQGNRQICQFAVYITVP